MQLNNSFNLVGSAKNPDCLNNDAERAPWLRRKREKTGEWQLKIGHDWQLVFQMTWVNKRGNRALPILMKKKEIGMQDIYQAWWWKTASLQLHHASLKLVSDASINTEKRKKRKNKSARCWCILDLKLLHLGRAPQCWLKIKTCHGWCGHF